MENTAEQDHLAAVARMRAWTAAQNPQYDWDTVCENCSVTLGEHKGKDFYCVTGPKFFRTIIEGSFYKGEMIARKGN
jgi:hypothetical protein